MEPYSPPNGSLGERLASHLQELSNCQLKLLNKRFLLYLLFAIIVKENMKHKQEA